MKSDPVYTGSTAGSYAGTEAFELIESLLWKGKLLRLEQHLARLHSSAGKFGFSFQQAAATRALQALTGTLDPAVPHKVRLLLGEDGRIKVTAIPLRRSVKEIQVVQLANMKVDSNDELLRHKTTRRQLFNQAGSQADSLGLADLLFCNEYGDVTEGSRNNVFLRSGGHLVTPPVEAGLLPGVYRQTVLSDNADVQIRPVPLAELLQADAIFLCNSVRGWRQVALLNGTVNLDMHHS